ncbi:acyltransferase [Clostridiales bacterium oral taxon 876 str. F0540]|nr:acyltransferase [Clostridiales bacterium oral taxon 876 str. F0540]
MIKPLTSLRFFAIFLVFLSHLGFIRAVPAYRYIFDNIFDEGYLGVTFFFMLSGFVISYNYLRKFKIINSKYNKNFILKRIAHIYPLHFITFFISLPLYIKDVLVNPIKNMIIALLNLLLLQSLVPKMSVYFSFNSVSWNLSVFMLLYLVTPILLNSINRFLDNYSYRLLPIVMIVIYFIAFIVIYFYKDSSANHWLFYISPFFRIIDYTIGLLLGSLFIFIKDVRLKSLAFSLLEPAVLILFIIVFVYHKNIHQTYRYGVYYMPIMAIIIFVFAFQRGFISKLLSTSILVALGNISFSFYMIHQLIIKYFSVTFSHLKIPLDINTMSLFIILTFLLSIFCSILSYKYFEGPLRNKMLKFVK